MNILITGANGQLGLSLKKHAVAFPSLNLIFTDVDELDITNQLALNEYFVLNKVDFVVNCAAYTAVDKAETEKDLAFRINVKAVEYLSILSAKHGFGLIHISTDFIFDGKKSRPYIETDKASPLSVYAETKAAAEEMICQNAQHSLILRTSWLYSEFGHNFVKTILKYAKERGELKVVCDQTGTPTYAGDLAEVILLLLSAKKIPAGNNTYHYSNQGTASWYDFAKSITEIAGISCRIDPVSTEEYPMPAIRPFYSVMSKAKFAKDFDIEIPYWRDSLKICLKTLANN